MSVRVAVLARRPQFGRVKTRLARHIGAPQALACHVHLLRNTLHQVRSSGLPAELLLAGVEGAGDGAMLRLQREFAIPTAAQTGPDIGARMLAAARRATTAGHYSIVLGSDCPVMTPAYLQQASAALQRGAEVVLGPAEDGGYVLIAQRQPQPQLFVDMEWGSATVYEETCRRLRALNCRWQALAPLWDVDTVADWRRWLALSD